MKIYYIVGLEHSGTTLSDYLLSAHPSVLGLGEISQFFSPSHMQRYMELWGDLPDVSLCSCGRSWRECGFWGELIDLCGLYSSDPLKDKYRKLLDHVRSTRGEDAVIVDSSKSVDSLKLLVEYHHDLGISLADILVVFTIKDARGFVTSMINKQEAKRSVVSVVQGFNYWTGANRGILAYLQSQGIDFRLNLYEHLCADPESYFRNQWSRAGLAIPVGGADMVATNSHIAMGNKNFVMRNRDRVEYDDRWTRDSLVKTVYRFHSKAKSFNALIRKMSPEAATHVVVDRGSPTRGG